MSCPYGQLVGFVDFDGDQRPLGSGYVETLRHGKGQDVRFSLSKSFASIVVPFV